MDYAKARKAMVDCQIRPNDVTDYDILRAFETIEREAFLPDALKSQAYVEKDLCFAPGRYLLSARDLAKLLQIAEPKADDLVLDVAGGGYSAALLAQICEMVVCVEPDETLAAHAESAFAAANITNAAVIKAEAQNGAPAQGPFDLIVIPAVLGRVPDSLLDQLAEDGRLVTIMADDRVGEGVVFTKTNNSVSRAAKFAAPGSDALPGFEATQQFSF